MRFLIVAFLIFGGSYVLPSPAAAQPADITAQISSKYGIPLVNGHLLYIGSGVLAQQGKPVEFPAFGQRWKIDPTSSYPAWENLYRRHAFQISESPDFRDTVRFARLALTPDVRRQIVEMLGIDAPWESGDMFEKYMIGRADQFARADLEKIITQNFHNKQTQGRIKYLMVQGYEVQNYDEASGIYQLRGHGIPRPGGYSLPDTLSVNMPDHTIRSGLALNSEEARVFYRSLTADAYSSKMAFSVIEGEMIFPESGSNTYTILPSKLAFYRDPKLTSQVEGVTLGSLYQDMRQERAERAADEKAAQQRFLDGADAREAARVAAEVAKRASEEKARADYEALLSETPLNVLGLTLGMDQTAAFAAINAARTEFGRQKLSISFGGPNCSQKDRAFVRLTDELSRVFFIENQTNRVEPSSQVNPEQEARRVQAIADFEAEYEEECGGVYTPVGDAFRLASADNKDFITLYFAPQDLGAHLVAVGREIHSGLIDLDSLDAIAAKQPFAPVEYGAGYRFWYTDRDRHTAAQGARSGKPPCTGRNWIVSKQATVQLSTFTAEACGDILGVQVIKAYAGFFLGDTDHFATTYAAWQARDAAAKNTAKIEF